MTDVPPLLTKCCTKCGEWKPLEQFSRHKSSKGGRRQQCTDCVVAYNRQRLARSEEAREKKRATERAYRKNPEFRQKRKDYVKEYLQREEVRERKNARERNRYHSIYEKPEAVLQRRLQERTAARVKLNDPVAREKKDRKTRLQAIRISIALATCRRLGIDLPKLAKEQYDAEQREKHARTENLQQGERASARDPEVAHGRPGN